MTMKSAIGRGRQIHKQLEARKRRRANDLRHFDLEGDLRSMTKRKLPLRKGISGSLDRSLARWPGLIGGSP